MKRLLISLLVFAILSVFVPKNTLGASSSYLLNGVNQTRVTRSIKTLKINAFLSRSATNRACYLYNTKVWNHNNFPMWIGKTGFLNRPKWVGEVLARNYSNDEDILRDWMNSESHKNVILDPSFVYMGMGKCGNVVVIHFGGN